LDNWRRWHNKVGIAKRSTTKTDHEFNAMSALPKGQLVINDDGTLTAQVRASRPERKTLRDWFDRLAASRPRGVLAHSRLEDGQRGLEIHYEPQPRDAVPVEELIRQWQTDLPGSVPAILDLGRFVCDVSFELAGRGFPDALVSPATVQKHMDSPAPWRLVPLPTRGISLADWARAEPITWLWCSSEMVIGGAGFDPARLLGAVLHHALTGSVMPESAPKHEKFARLLRDRVGLPARLGTSIRSALPPSLEEDAAALERLVLDCLETAEELRPSATSVKERFTVVAEKLSTNRLVRYWEFEKQPAIVARLVVPTGGFSTSRAAEASPPPAPPAVPWDEQVPKLVEQGDLSGALEAAWNDIHENGPARIRFYLAVLQRIAARQPGPATVVASAIERLTAAFGDKLDESDVLRLVHIRTRHLAEKTDRLGVAHRKFTSRWNDATARLIHARLTLTTGEAYNQVSRLCKEARGLYESMPEKGGRAGHYATAYLYLLDGIAHVGAVSLYKNDSFYNDAFDAFGRSLELAGRCNHDGLIRSSLHWLGWMGRFTSVAPGSTFSLLSAGIEAVLSAHGLTTHSLAASGIPEIPWYDEAQIFPV
jgi:hypothetical protein